jgi:hypothetical protein
MMSFYYLYDAKKRMKEIQRFIKGTPDVPMLLAQRDIIQVEIDHYSEECLNIVYFILTLTIFCSIVYGVWHISSNILHIIRMFS